VHNIALYVAYDQNYKAIPPTEADMKSKDELISNLIQLRIFINEMKVDEIKPKHLKYLDPSPKGTCSLTRIPYLYKKNSTVTDACKRAGVTFGSSESQSVKNLIIYFKYYADRHIESWLYTLQNSNCLSSISDIGINDECDVCEKYSRTIKIQGGIPIFGVVKKEKKKPCCYYHMEDYNAHKLCEICCLCKKNRMENCCACNSNYHHYKCNILIFQQKSDKPGHWAIYFEATDDMYMRAEDYDYEKEILSTKRISKKERRSIRK
jgi:hypothetical protein